MYKADRLCLLHEPAQIQLIISWCASTHVLYIHCTCIIILKHASEIAANVCVSRSVKMISSSLVAHLFTLQSGGHVVPIHNSAHRHGKRRPSSDQMRDSSHWGCQFSWHIQIGLVVRSSLNLAKQLCVTALSAHYVICLVWVITFL